MCIDQPEATTSVLASLDQLTIVQNVIYTRGYGNEYIGTCCRPHIDLLQRTCNPIATDILSYQWQWRCIKSTLLDGCSQIGVGVRGGGGS